MARRRDRSRFGRAVGKYLRNVDKATKQAVEIVTLRIFSDSQRQVPVDTGVLRSSGEVRFRGRGTERRGEITYGTEYAIYVHERLDLNHNQPTKAKYLTDPYEQHAPTLKDEVKRRLQRIRNRTGRR